MIDDPKQQTLDQLYTDNYPTLQQAIYDEYSDCLAFDADAILHRAAQRVSRFLHAPEEFISWSERFVRATARHRKHLYALLAENERVIYSAILRSRSFNYKDCAVDPDDLFSEVVGLIFTRVNSLSKPGRAKTSTRIYKLTCKHMFFHTAKQATRFKTVECRVNDGRDIGCEALSELEQQELSQREDLRLCA